MQYIYKQEEKCVQQLSCGSMVLQHEFELHLDAPSNSSQQNWHKPHRCFPFFLSLVFETFRAWLGASQHDLKVLAALTQSPALCPGDGIRSGCTAPKQLHTAVRQGEQYRHSSKREKNAMLKEDQRERIIALWYPA